MAATTNLKLVITAKDNATKELKKVSGEVEKAGGKVKNFIKDNKAVIFTVGTMAVAIGTKAVKSAATFSKSMANVSTLVDTGTESMDEMKGAILDMSKRVPVPLSELASALYDVRSAGISAEESMTVLESAAQLGVAGLGTTKEAVDLATSSINAFALEGDDAMKAFDILQLTVKSGKTNISELSQSFGMVAGTAKSSKVPFQELMAATAALTTTGQTASVAQNQLKTAILAINAPTADMNELIKKAGFESGATMLEQLGLVGSMEKIDEAAKGNIDVLKKSYGSAEALGSAISLTGEQSEAYTDIMDQMTDSSGALNEAFEKQNNDVSAQYEILKNKLNVEMITLGNVIIPFLLTSMDKAKINFEKFTDFLSKFIYLFYLVRESMLETARQISKSLDPVVDIIYKMSGAFKTLSGWGDKIADAFIGVGRSIASSLKPAIDFINRMIAAYNNLPGTRNIKEIDVGIRRQFGGSAMRGRAITVGEQGPETFIPYQSGNIRNAQQMGKTEINISIHDPVVREEQDLERIFDLFKRKLAAEQLFSAKGINI